MEQASQIGIESDLAIYASEPGAARSPRMVLHFAVLPGATFVWHARNHAEIRVHDAKIWLTRSYNARDYWMSPGDVLRIRRGERIWLSTDAPHSAEVSITMTYRQETPPGPLAKLLASAFKRLGQIAPLNLPRWK